jgi:cytochrome c-type biogenesis protein CcmH
MLTLVRACAVLCLSLIASSPVCAQTKVETVSDSVLEARTVAVASTLRCPVCQGESIQDSPADLAQEMRSLVKDMLREGKTPAEIRAYFVSKYGEWILLEPAMTGMNVLLYLFPVAVAIGGTIFVVMTVKRWSKNPDVTTSPVEQSSTTSRQS